MAKKKTKKSIKSKTEPKFVGKVDDSILNADKLIELSLFEDIGHDFINGDITSLSIIPKTKKIKAQIRVKEHCVLCGIDLAQRVFDVYEKLSKINKKDKIKFNILRRDGSFMQKNEVIADIEGNAITILTCERTILNFLSRLSGISTMTNRYVERLMMHKAQLLDTRKTIGAYRALEKYAVRVGGGSNHRKGLYDMFLIKDNHIDTAGSVSKAVEMAVKYREDMLRKIKNAKINKSNKKQDDKIKNIKIEVEVESLKQLDEVLRLKNMPDIIMLDNLSYEEMEIAVDKIHKVCRLKRLHGTKKDIKIEASGSVRLENISEVAKCGVDFISVGNALTLGAKPIDFTMDVIE
ncbi:MAG: carboxylating nicotinate-nucleotide diphosphorylase [Candidatus Woesearchaeota archaeon]